MITLIVFSGERSVANVALDCFFIGLRPLVELKLLFIRKIACDRSKLGHWKVFSLLKFVSSFQVARALEVAVRWGGLLVRLDFDFDFSGNLVKTHPRRAS